MFLYFNQSSTSICTHMNIQIISLKYLLDTSRTNETTNMSHHSLLKVVHSTKSKSKLRNRLPCLWQRTIHRHDVVHTIDFLRVLRHKASATIGTGSWLHPAPPSIHRFSSAHKQYSNALHNIASHRITHFASS